MHLKKTLYTIAMIAQVLALLFFILSSTGYKLFTNSMEWGLLALTFGIILHNIKVPVEYK